MVLTYSFFFSLRLQYFARGAQGYMKKLRESLQAISQEKMKEEENRIKVTALRTTSNINSLIRDLFRNPPIYKATVTLSFKPPTGTSPAKAPAAVNKTAPDAQPADAASGKRHAPITFESSPPKVRQQGDRGQRQPYVVPSGKFSANVTSSGKAIKMTSIGCNDSINISFPIDSRPRGRGGYRGGRGFRRGGY